MNFIWPVLVGPTIRALKGILSSSIYLTLYALQPFALNVDRCVGDCWDEAFYSISGCTPSCVFTRRNPLAWREWSVIEPMSTSGPNFFPVKNTVTFWFGFCTPFKKKGLGVGLIYWFQSAVVDPVRWGIDRYAHLGVIGVQTVFSVPSSRRVVFDKQKEDHF